MRKKCFSLKPVVITISTALLSTQGLANDNSSSYELEPVVVKGSTEGTKSYYVDYTKSGTGVETELQYLPQSVTVLSNQQIRDKGVTNTMDALRHVNGLQIRDFDSYRLMPFARGFNFDQVSYDNALGTYESSFIGMDSNLLIYDKVEILRGADGLLKGAGNPGASINFVRKRANSKIFTGELNLKTGNYNRYGVGADIVTPLNKSGTLRGRIIADYENNKSFYENTKIGNGLLYGVVDADITDGTQLSFGVNLLKGKTDYPIKGMYPIWYQDGSLALGDHNKSLNYAPDWTYTKTAETDIFFKFKQSLGERWYTELSFDHRKQKRDSLLFSLQFMSTTQKDGTSTPGRSMPNLPPFYTSALDNSATAKNSNLNLILNGTTTLLNREHDVILGYSYNRYDLNADLIQGVTIKPINLYDASTYPAITDLLWLSPTRLRNPKPFVNSMTAQNGLYTAITSHIGKDFRLLYGARYATWKNKDYLKNSNRSQNKILPYLGGVYSINNNFNIYTSYTSSFTPQNERNQSGQYLKPKMGNNYEIGVKSQFFDDKLSANLSVFNTIQKNIALKAGVFVEGTPQEMAYRASNKVKSRGFELDINGEITDQLNVSLGYAQWNAKEQGIKINTDVPRKQINFFTAYGFRGVLNGLVIGGGINWLASTDTPENNYTDPINMDKYSLQQKSYALVNVMGRYNFKNNMSLQLNIDNLFNKKYYSYSNNMFGQYIYGKSSARTAKLDFSYKF